MNPDATLDTWLEELRQAVRADRVTLRLDTPGMNFPCAGEARGPGIRAISEDNSLDQRGAATASWVAATHRTLVQPDLSAADPAPPQALLDAYGVRAQMLAPVLAGGELAGWVSVHSATAREWSAADVAAIETTATRCAAALPALHASPGYRRWLAPG